MKQFRDIKTAIALILLTVYMFFCTDSAVAQSGGVDFVPASDITNIPSAAVAGTRLTLSGTVVPPNATNKNIVWSVRNAGSTGAIITGDSLDTSAEGTVFVTAKVANGAHGGAIAAISVGATHSMVLKTNGSLWAWGNNENGQLGDGDDWDAISAGRSHTVALKNDGSLWAWGHNLNGQLGDGSTTDRTSPVQIGNDNDWVAISAGYYHTVALKNDGSLWAWGGNGYGQMGFGPSTGSNAPIRVDSGNDWKAISAGGGHTVALKNDGSFWAWGWNGNGQLGDDSNKNRDNPVQIGNDNNWVAISAGYYHTVALKNDGSLWAWGNNEKGQLGVGRTADDPGKRNIPLRIGADANWAAISTFGSHSMAIRQDGSLWAWGWNEHGQLGDSTTLDRNAPVRIGENNDWSEIAAGIDHSLALKTDGSLWAWGNNENGQLGDGMSDGCVLPAEIVTSDFVKIFSIPVSFASLTGIEITAPPAKIDYMVGEALNISGIIVTATYENGLGASVTEFSTVPAEGTVFNTVGEQIVKISYGGYSAEFLVMANPVPVVLESIVVTALPEKTVYIAGEPLDLANMVVSARFSDGSIEPVTAYNTSPANGAALDEIGQLIVTVNYGGKTTDFTITVSNEPAILENISITVLPEKVVYTVGETFNLTGMVVNAKFSDGSVEPVAAYNTYPVDGAVLFESGLLTVTVDYGGKTTGFSIMVSGTPITLRSITVTVLPEKIVYTTGESLDLAGMVITAAYSNGTTAPITGYITDPVDGHTLNTSENASTVAVRYGGRTAYFTVMVSDTAIDLERIEITTLPVKTIYTAGEPLDLAGITVIAVYSDATTAQVVGFSTNPADGDALAQDDPLTVTVNYGGKTADFNITVNAVPAVGHPVLEGISNLLFDTGGNGLSFREGAITNRGGGNFAVTIFGDNNRMTLHSIEYIIENVVGNAAFEHTVTKDGDETSLDIYEKVAPNIYGSDTSTEFIHGGTGVYIIHDGDILIGTFTVVYVNTNSAEEKPAQQSFSAGNYWFAPVVLYESGIEPGYMYEIISRPATLGGTAPWINASGQFVFAHQVMPSNISRAGEYVIRVVNASGDIIAVYVITVG